MNGVGVTYERWHAVLVGADSCTLIDSILPNHRWCV